MIKSKQRIDWLRSTSDLFFRRICIFQIDLRLLYL